MKKGWKGLHSSQRNLAVGLRWVSKQGFSSVLISLLTSSKSITKLSHSCRRSAIPHLVGQGIASLWGRKKRLKSTMVGNWLLSLTKIPPPRCSLQLTNSLLRSFSTFDLIVSMKMSMAAKRDGVRVIPIFVGYNAPLPNCWYCLMWTCIFPLNFFTVMKRLLPRAKRPNSYT